MVNILFDKPNDRTVSIGNVFESQYRGGKGSNIQEIILIKNSIHWFMNKIVVKEGHQ